MYLGLNNAAVVAMDLETGKQVKNFAGHHGSVECCYFDEEANLLFTGSADCSIRCFDIKSGKCERVFKDHSDTVTCLQMHNGVLYSGSLDSSCKAFDLVSGQCIRSFERLGMQVYDIHMTKQGEMYTATDDDKIRVFVA
eukprot:GEZU01020546.1.p2 GENE.GEZU01020546.1~~GEZU01020546.1.p2  ORF type:complete len:139 (-),score=20.39 GEZU01020546.1:38-454(-)